MDAQMLSGFQLFLGEHPLLAVNMGGGPFFNDHVHHSLGWNVFDCSKVEFNALARQRPQGFPFGEAGKNQRFLTEEVAISSRPTALVWANPYCPLPSRLRRATFPKGEGFGLLKFNLTFKLSQIQLERRLPASPL